MSADTVAKPGGRNKPLPVQLRDDVLDAVEECRVRRHIIRLRMILQNPVTVGFRVDAGASSAQIERTIEE